MPQSCAHYHSTKSTECLMHGNQRGVIVNQSDDRLVEGIFHSTRVTIKKPKFWSKVEKKSWCVLQYHSMYLHGRRLGMYFMKLVTAGDSI